MDFIQKNTNVLLSIGCGLLLFIAWPVSPLTVLIFFSFIPLLWLEMRVVRKRKFLLFTYITMLIWNISTTWWIWNASAPGAVAAFIANSFLMCLPWLGYKIAKKKLGDVAGYVSLIAFWMCFEYIHLQDWGLSWPWLTLGNAFATHPQWIQWYEYTGTSGGTLWVLLANIILFLHIKNNTSVATKKNYSYLIAAVLIIILPFLFSFLLTDQMHKSTGNKNMVVAQPNIDPYEKVSTTAGSFEGQLQKLITTSEKQVDSNTTLLVWPETALYMESGINEDELKSKQNFLLNPLWSFLSKHPNLTLFSGVESFKWIDSASKYSRLYNGQNYESYNGGVLLDSSGAQAFYHKSMLVPGVETLPWFLKFIDNWFEKFGGTTAGYARQEARTVIDTKKGIKIAPSICYESIYGEYMSRYIRNGANLICIITNDGWWKKTPGHKQHMNYARLRAIETRTWVARSANTGISCFINPYGTVIAPQPYNTTAAIQLDLPSLSNHQTFYVRYGDVLSKIMVALSILLAGWVIVKKVTLVFSKKNNTING
jgi:apolipoprotein N-acyltransferase